ncbi:MAG: hypothetical protein H8E34_10930 [Bacteroidetes bacterium]|nr:hypothetical protein [Bacteroidota bacterium]
MMNILEFKECTLHIREINQDNRSAMVDCMCPRCHKGILVSDYEFNATTPIQWHHTCKDCFEGVTIIGDIQFPMLIIIRGFFDENKRLQEIML